MTGEQKRCSVVMQWLGVFRGDTEWSPLECKYGHSDGQAAFAARER